MISSATAERLLLEIAEEIATETDLEQAAAVSMRIISENLPHFNWVGIYWLSGDELRLGPYVGAPTEHAYIAVGVGVCGTAVASNANQVVDDVRLLDNYLACSIETRSEIVVLLRDEHGEIYGQIDADGHEVSAFDTTDEVFLDGVATRLTAKRKELLHA